MTQARDLAGSARRLLRTVQQDLDLRSGKLKAAGLGRALEADLPASIAELEHALAAWDDAGNPPELPAADQRLTYYSTGLQYLQATGTMSLGAFGMDALATEGAKLRHALGEHLEACRLVWQGEDHRLGPMPEGLADLFKKPEESKLGPQV